MATRTAQTETMAMEAVGARESVFVAGLGVIRA
jgi:hypothetical protein